jgi:acyl carrier protein
MKDSTSKKIVTIISKILDVDENDLTIKSNSDNLKNWDSLANFVILQSLEKNFSIKIKIQDINKLNSIKDIISLVKKYK